MLAFHRYQEHEMVSTAGLLNVFLRLGTGFRVVVTIIISLALMIVGGVLSQSVQALGAILIVFGLIYFLFFMSIEAALVSKQDKASLN